MLNPHTPSRPPYGGHFIGKFSRPARALLAVVLVLNFFLPAVSLAAPAAQIPSPEERAQQLLAQLTPEERVGQLFLVTFTGSDVSDASQIYDLIFNRHVGGVLLQASNDNFVARPDTVTQTWTMIQDLQRVEWLSSQTALTLPGTQETFRPGFIPLFVAISQEGDGYPNDQILSGLSPIPNAMAIGATWSPDLAERAGQTLGAELQTLGFNLLIGPSLDVLENPNPESLSDLGTRTFGGDPYWVGQMGRAFITGVHEGSNYRIAVVGKHFPGHGGTDRLPEEEIPTVRKSLAQLSQIELAPFFAVTGGNLADPASVDGLLLSHIRYQGFQGNIRITTRPISFDPQAFPELMALEPFAAWRAQGGLIISDKLGTRAVRQFYVPFNSRLVARDAFLAGNDLLNLGNFVADDDPDTYTSIVRTLDFFTQKYNEDLAFAQRVDQSVARILTVKFRLYGSFRLDTVLTGETPPSMLGQDPQTAFEIARTGASLLNPSPVDLESLIPSPPQLSEQITFITDSYNAAQCSTCPQEPVLAVTAMEEAVARLYGPEAGGQVVRQNLASFSFTDLETLLDNPDASSALLSRIRSSEWVVFLSLDANPNRPGSLALQRFLSERPELLQQKKILVFALGAPYYFDATDISKFTAYYGLYSKTPQSIEIAARILFKELAPIGASPVSIPGLDYDLIQITSPDPAQSFLINLGSAAAGEEPIPVEALGELHPGDSLTLSTSIILDRNGHPVPDNVPVTFNFNTTLDGITILDQITATTSNGIAETTYVLDSPGVLDIQASSGEPPALSSALSLEVIGPETVVITPQTQSPTAGGTEAGVQPQPTESVIIPTPPREKTTVSDWILTVLIAGFIGVIAYQVGVNRGESLWGARWALSALLGGLVVNAYLSLNLPGSVQLIRSAQVWGVALAAAFGAGAGWAAGWAWQQREKKNV